MEYGRKIRAAMVASSTRDPSRSLPERVAQLYYAHGLFCSSHPVPVISFAIAIVLLCCYPLLNLPLPGNVPQRLWSPARNLSVPGTNNSWELGDNQPPRWYTGSPLCYVQQVVLKTAVLPWTDDLVLSDAFRSPLAEVFKLLEIIGNYQHENSSKTLSHLCLHVEAVKTKPDKRLTLPEYNCLVVSPANFWQQNTEMFLEDTNILGTIYNYQNLQKGKISLAEILFGVNMKETGIKRYPLRTRQRIVQFAVTIVLQDYDTTFIAGLQHRLADHYPLHQQPGVAPNDTQDILHVYYPGKFNLHELVPLTMTYLILFLYMYFSVRKMELVKSKVGMALSAVVTVLASLSMSVGLCFFFGLTLNLHGQVFPYLVVIVGLENVLVLTKSVVSTPTHLDVKIRVAQGLSKEGWSITKNLLTEVTILTIGLFTFVPAIQEFCIFAVVGLLSDFFLQMLFFSTVLAIDIRRMELSSDHRSLHSSHPVRQFRSPTPGSPPYPSKTCPRSMVRSKSHPRLNGLSVNVVAPINSPPILAKVPKRLRLVHFWARTRIFQRAFMVCMVVWISVITYNSGFVEHYLQVDRAAELDKQYYLMSPNVAAPDRATVLNNIMDLKTLSSLIAAEEGSTTLSAQHKGEGEDMVRQDAADSSRLRHSGPDTWHRLSHYHWPAILSLYNTSLAGRYVSLLPSIRLSHVVTPEEAKLLRNPNEKAAHHFQWQALAAALDPLDFSDGENSKTPTLQVTGSHQGYLGSEVPFVPSSPMELFLTAVLCVISVVVLAYTTVVLYRCVCTRNYAEWRASWAGEGDMLQDGISQVVMEAVPLILDGHPQEVECLATDGSMVVSSCLGGQLRIWDSVSGEPVATIDRKMYFSTLQRGSGGCDEELPLSDYESGSPPSRGEVTEDQGLPSPLTKTNYRPSQWDLPDLRPAINTSFSGAHHDSQHDDSAGYDFAGRYRGLLEEHRRSLEPEAEEVEESSERRGCQASELTPKPGTSDRRNCQASEWTSKLVTGECRNCQASEWTPKHEERSVQIPFDRGGTPSASHCRLRRGVDFERPSLENPSGSGGVWWGGNECMDNSPTERLSRGPSIEERSNKTGVPPIWCLDCQENLVAVGCSNGRLEFWEGSSGRLKCVFEDGGGVGVTAVKIIGNRVVTAKLSGSVDFLELESYSQGRQMDWGFTAYRRTHVRTGSAGSVLDWDAMVSRDGGNEDIRCIRLNTTKAHQQPITVLDSEGGQVLTGSQDHTLKVFRLEDQLPLYTLHGHCGPITCLFIDRISPMMSGSGSQDGLLCVWDLLTGACMYSIQAHDGSVAALTYSASYVISLGTDERLCVWERFQGHLLNTIQVAHTYCSSMVMFTHNLLITSKQGSLVVWDVRTGDPVRVVKLGHRDNCVFVKQVLLLRDSVVCDYSNQLRIVRFPLVADKCD